MAVERLPVRNVRRIDNGWVVLAGTRGEYIFEVDVNGESAECVPWDDEMERELQLHGEDIPPTYESEPTPKENVYQQAARRASALLADSMEKDRQRREADNTLPGQSSETALPDEPVGIITQTDPGLYHAGAPTEEYVVPVSSRELTEDGEEYQPAAEKVAHGER